MYQKPSGPLSISGVLDDGFQLLKASFTRIFPISLVAAIAGQVPTAITTETGEISIAPVAAIVAFFAVFLLSLLCYGAAISRTLAISHNENTGIGAAIQTGLKRAPALFVCSLLYGLCIIAGMILLVIPGIIVFISLLFATYFTVGDKLGPINSLKQSHRLVWGGNWWRTAAIVSVIGIVMLVAYSLIGVFAGVFAAAVSSDSAMLLNIVNFVLIPLLSAVASPVGYAFSVSLFNDLKIRRDGADLAQRMEGLGTA